MPLSLPPTAPHCSIVVLATLVLTLSTGLLNHLLFRSHKINGNTCQLGRHVRLPFVALTSHTTRPFELIHWIYGHLPLRAYLVSNISLSFLMFSLIVCGLFLSDQNRTMVVNLTTPCCPILPLSMVRFFDFLALHVST